MPIVLNDWNKMNDKHKQELMTILFFFSASCLGIGLSIGGIGSYPAASIMGLVMCLFGYITSLYNLCLFIRCRIEEARGK